MFVVEKIFSKLPTLGAIILQMVRVTSYGTTKVFMKCR